MVDTVGDGIINDIWSQTRGLSLGFGVCLVILSLRLILWDFVIFMMQLQIKQWTRKRTEVLVSLPELESTSTTQPIYTLYNDMCLVRYLCHVLKIQKGLAYIYMYAADLFLALQLLCAGVVLDFATVELNCVCCWSAVVAISWMPSLLVIIRTDGKCFIRDF